MGSNIDWLMGFGRGLEISADKNQESFGCANVEYFVHP